MIDIENLKQFLGSDEEFIAMLMDKFIQEMPREAETLKKLVQERDWQRARSSAHKMLSSTKIFNLEELTSVLERIEKSEANADRIPELIPEFDLACKNVLQEMKQQREKLGK